MAILLLLLIGQSIRTERFGWSYLLTVVTALLLGAALRRPTGPLTVAASESVPEREPHSRPLEQQVESIRSAHGAERAVLWQIRSEGERAAPWIVRGGVYPETVFLFGDVLGWAARENVTVRQDRKADWALPVTAACAVVPVRAGTTTALLSLEFADARALPEIADLEGATHYLASLIDLEHERGVGYAQRDQLNAVASVLKRLPEELDTDRFAEQLALFAVQLTHATGAAVSEWEREKGRVLAVATDGESPRPGLVFAVGESESALAARAGDTLFRRERARDALPVIAHEESFAIRPRTVAAVPLLLQGETVGVLTLWTTEAELDGEALRWVETLAPYLALQLRHSRAYGQMRERADRDRLTGLYNRQAFDSLLAVEVARYQRYLRPFTLLLLDVDHFKSINDRYGHPTGDAVLANVGRVLTRTLREVDVAARYGGEEFAVLLPETELDIGHDIAERLRSAVAASIVHAPGGQISVTVSVGLSACPACAGDPDGLIRTADAALYKSKQHGRNQVTAAAALN
jgi:diguanylate cyclase (GGDEF)-like protein